MFARILTLALKASIILLMLAAPVMAHSWYEWDCCSNMDCAPIIEQTDLPDGSIKATTTHGTTIFPRGFPKDKIRASKDEKAHACMRVDPYAPPHAIKAPLCLYLPMLF